MGPPPGTEKVCGTCVLLHEQNAAHESANAALRYEYGYSRQQVHKLLEERQDLLHEFEQLRRLDRSLNEDPLRQAHMMVRIFFTSFRCHMNLERACLQCAWVACHLLDSLSYSYDGFGDQPGGISCCAVCALALDLTLFMMSRCVSYDSRPHSNDR